MLKTSERPVVMGFTLIELLVVVVIVAILATIAAPSFSELIRRNQVRSAADSVLGALQLSRGEAVSRNARITFTLGSGTGQSSWSVADADGNIIQQSRASGEGTDVVTVVVTPSAATSITFNGFGRTVSSASNISTILFGASGTTLTRQVEIQSGGQIRLCDPSVVTAGDPRRCLL